MSSVMRTKVVDTKFGAIYVTSYWRNGTLEDNERVRFYDEYDRLIDYYENDDILEWCEDEGKSPQTWIDDYAEVLASKDTIEDLLDYMCVQYDYCGTSKQKAKEALADGWADRTADDVSDYELETNEFVLIFDNYYVVVRDY